MFYRPRQLNRKILLWKNKKANVKGINPYVRKKHYKESCGDLLQLIDCLYRHLHSDDLTTSCSHSNFNLVTTVADGEVVLVRQCLVGVSL